VYPFKRYVQRGVKLSRYPLVWVPCRLARVRQSQFEESPEMFAEHVGQLLAQGKIMSKKYSIFVLYLSCLYLRVRSKQNCRCCRIELGKCLLAQVVNGL
jgi:hypothetical protein